jgi:hypothetical protein
MRACFPFVLNSRFAPKQIRAESGRRLRDAGWQM